jgi:hypothetical protein
LNELTIELAAAEAKLAEHEERLSQSRESARTFHDRSAIAADSILVKEERERVEGLRRQIPQPTVGSTWKYVSPRERGFNI